MRRSFRAWLVLLVGGALFPPALVRALPEHDAPRLVVPLAADWRFAPEDEARASAPDFDDTAWAAVRLPHTWNALDGQDGGRNYRRGPGWYRTRLRQDATASGRQLYLEFDGASLQAELFVNGRRLGKHEGGFAQVLYFLCGVRARQHRSGDPCFGGAGSAV